MNEMTSFLEPLDFYIGRLAAQQAEIAAAIPETNFPVSTPRLGVPEYPNHQEVPCSLYFYYVRYIPGSGLDVRHYFYPRGAHDDVANPPPPSTWPTIPNTQAALQPVLLELIDNARRGGSDFPFVGRDFQNIRWRRKSYIALFIDDESWMPHRSSTGQDPILFIIQQVGRMNGTPNHSFFDGQVFDIPTNAGATRPVFVCINHMKQDEAGTDLEQANSPELFQFKIFTRVGFVGGGTAPLTVIFDPDGNNIGPPLPPP